MSISERDERRLEAELIFQQRIEDDPSVCNGCFERPLPERRQGVDLEAKHESGGEPCSSIYDYWSEHTCPQCGSVGMAAPDETLSIAVASERALSLSTRLRECGIDHDWRLLVWFVRRAKRESGIHTKDRDIAARAVEFAVAQSR